MAKVAIRLKALAPFVVVIAVLAIPLVASATSLASCIDRGVELRESFSVKVTHQDKPLRGANIAVTGATGSSGQPSYSILTGPDGRVHFAKLPPGDYWIKAEYFGVIAGYECFHINSLPSAKSKKSRQYEWGDMPVAVRLAAGKLVDSQPGKDGTSLDRLLHRISTPIVGAKLELRKPLESAVYKTVSHATGHFQFDDVPEGIYVLHVDANSTSSERVFDSTDLLIQLGKTANIGTLLLVTDDASGGRHFGIQVTQAPQ